MIKELRVGNWINSCRYNDKKNVRVYDIGITGVNSYNYDTNCIWFEDHMVSKLTEDRCVEPIPLTDEWKTKLSFKQFPYEPENLNEGYYWSLQIIKGIYLTIEDGDDYAYLDYGLDFNGTKNLIKYQFVHEIQNVYNILKKEDITIK